MLKTMVFDMGNVLVHFCHELMCTQIAAVCETSQSEVRRLLIDSGLQWNFERGLHTPEQLHAQVEQLLQKPVSFEQLRRAASDIFRLNQPIVPVLDSLRQQGFRLVLLSNTSQWHYEFIRDQFDVLDRFDDFVLSYEAGAIKPDAAIFERLLTRLECEPQQAFYTDDIAAYVEAGRTWGLQAEVFTDVPQLTRHLEERGIQV